MEDANAGAQIGLTLKTMMMKQQSGSFEDFASSFDHHYRLMTEQPTDNTKKMNLLSGLTNDKVKVRADNLVGSHPNISYDDLVARLLAYTRTVLSCKQRWISRGFTVTTIHTDNSGEYTTAEFGNYIQKTKDYTSTA